MGGRSPTKLLCQRAGQKLVCSVLQGTARQHCHRPARSRARSGCGRCGPQPGDVSSTDCHCDCHYHHGDSDRDRDRDDHDQDDDGGQYDAGQRLPWRYDDSPLGQECISAREGVGIPGAVSLPLLGDGCLLLKYSALVWWSPHVVRCRTAGGLNLALGGSALRMLVLSSSTFLIAQVLQSCTVPRWCALKRSVLQRSLLAAVPAFWKD